MPKRFKLYYFPTSYYSQKVLLVLYEKRIDFDKGIVNISVGEQNAAWYTKINPQGVVPVLLDNGRPVTESDDIANYLDENIDTGEKLIPHTDSKAGQDVRRWRERFGVIPIEEITFGVVLNPELSVSGVQIATELPSFTPEGIIEKLKSTKALLQLKAENDANLRDDYLRKIEIIEKRMEVFTNKQVITRYLSDLEQILDDVEVQLATTRKEQGFDDAWLLGTRYTMADINLTILLERLKFLGLTERFLVENKRPCLFDFNRRIQQRRSLQLLHKGIKSLPYLMIKSRLRKSAPVIGGVVVLGVSIGVLVLVYLYKK